ncbi:MAG TPA: Gfo/Idh/MocA family oxidoreductase [Bacteroidota bacterium]|nr:Gfo/Idh/MocA family oxidoreductase [Bacteroidota bacterium]
MIKGAIIGLGKIAQTAHLPAFAFESLRPRAEIIAAAEPDEQIRLEVQANYPHIKLYASAEELIEHEKVDFIDICTPPNMHSPLIRLALSRGLHLICEKPFALDAQESQCLAEKLRHKSSVVFVPCHQYTYSPLWSALHEFVGLARHEGSVFIQSSVYRTSSDPGIAADGKGWRMNRAVSGGGILSDTGVHYFALAEWLLGMPEEVTCRTYHLEDSAQSVEDTATVELKHPAGIFQFTLTWAADRRANLLRAVTRRRSFVYDGGVKALTFEDGACRSIITVPDASDKSQYVVLYEKLFAEFFSMIETGERQEAHIDSALHASLVLDAAYRSAREGTTVHIGAQR